jgi:hypothetical protein
MATRKEPAPKPEDIKDQFEREVAEMLGNATLQEVMREETRNIIRMVIAKELFGLDTKVVQNAHSGQVLNYIFTPNYNYPHAPLGAKLVEVVRGRLPIIAPQLALEIAGELEVSPEVKQAAKDRAQKELDDYALGEIRSVVWDKAKAGGKAFAEKTVEAVMKARKWV